MLSNKGLVLLIAVALAASAQAVLPVSGSVIHIEADALGLADGAAVSSWGSFDQATADNQPTYVAVSAEYGGHAVVRFDGSNDYMPWTPAAPFNVGSVTMFAVGNFLLDGANQYMVAGQDGSGDDRIRFAVDTGGYEYRIGSTGWKAINTGPGTADEAVHVFCITSTAEGILDGSSVGTASNTSSQIPVAFGLGSINVGEKDFFSGDIAELVVYDRVLTSAEIASVSTYLAQKYSVVIEPVAVNPTPFDTATTADPTATMTWEVINAISPTFDINIGTTSACNEFISGVSTGSSMNYTPSPGLLNYATQYYWRVDITDGGIEYPGRVWSFITGGKATDPVPPSGGTASRLSGVLSWSGDALISSYDVYFGTPGNLQLVHKDTATSVSFGDLEAVIGQSPLPEGDYQWRIDTRNASNALMVTGDIWDVSIPPVSSFQTITGSGITVMVSSNGDYSVSKDSPAFTYSGNLNQTLGSLQETAGGKDGIGPYRELTFTYDSGNYQGSIKVYTNGRPVCLFTTTCLGAQTDLGSYFPFFTSQPTGLYHHGYSGKWCVEQWTRDGIATDSPRIYFDDNKNTVIISAAANYMDAYLEHDATGIKSGIQSWATGLPDGYTHRTIVVVDNGILETFDKWGSALCDLQGKIPPANDADMGLKYISYWTDNGATYYYNYGSYGNYDNLLITLKDHYHDNLHIRLGSIQLDSWWYIKDPSNPFNNSGWGCYLYEPVPSFFPVGLADLQSRIGIPFITHNRWISSSSPYRSDYTFSNNVSIDPNFWDEIIGNIASWGVKTYEQDWLDINATPENTQGHGELFMKYMAEKCAANDIMMQYCMAVPRHYMQATKYDHVTTLRCLQDRFSESKWKDLFWKTPFIHAIGSWPWVDVFRSNEDGNFLLCVLSGGMVGMADSIGGEDTANILKAVRRDGVVVKPDIPIRPSDATFLNRASSGSTAITGYTYSQTNKKKILYVFDWNTSSGFSASEFGLSGDIYVYDYLADTGFMTTASASIGGSGSVWRYYVITPIESSGIGIIGDKGKWVTAGQQRISGISEGGSGMTLTVQFGAFDALTADEPAEIIGYCPVEPTLIPGIDASVTVYSYDPATGIFQFTFEPSSSYSDEVSRNVTITTLVGDIAGSYGVDLVDFAYLVGYWGLSDCGGANDCGRADIDISGDVGLDDLYNMVTNWLQN